MVTCDQQGKVLSSQKVLLWIFPEIRNLFWRYAELNCLILGTGQIPSNIKLQQDNRTVCCSHKIVSLETFHYSIPVACLSGKGHGKKVMV